MPHRTHHTLPELWDTYITDGRPHGSPTEDAITRAVLPIVRTVVDRLKANYPPTVDRNEMTSNAYLALLEAIRKYDPAKGEFEPFVIFTIRQRVADGLRQGDWISRRRRDNVKAVIDATGRLHQKGIDDPTHEEIAAEAHLTVEDVTTAHTDALAGRVNSLDALTSDGRDIAGDIGATVGPATSPTEAIYTAFDLDSGLSDHFWDAVRLLADRPKQMLAMYLCGGHEYKEIAEVFSITESRVSQIFKDTGRRLRQNMETLSTTG